MPNTLAHIGIQGIATRSWLKTADLKWIALGCIIPDLPWIFQRLINLSFSNLDRYDLRLFATVQSSLLFCLILSLALAVLSRQFWKIFLILGANSLLHLSLDAMQIKWANGIHVFAPFNWQMINYGIFWPESFPTFFLSILGFIYFLFSWRKSLATHEEFTFKPGRVCLAVFFISAYFILPFFLLKGPENANNHFVKTLRYEPIRQGKYIELDRAFYMPQNKGAALRTYAGEEIEAEGIKLNRPVSVSIRGTFISNDRIRVSEYYVHTNYFRDIASYIGLGLIALLWIMYFFRRQVKGQRTIG